MKTLSLQSATIVICFGLLAVMLAAGAQQSKPRHPHYKLIELGTFGGPISYINPVGNGGPYMNRSGAVVGSSMTSIPIPPGQNGFSCPFPPNEVFHTLEWANGGVTDLGSLGDSSNCSNALGINDTGVAVGTSENGNLDPVTGVLQLRAVLWRDGKIRSLGTLGGNHSLASSINNRGQIVGFALNQIPDPFSFFDFGIGGSTSGAQTRAFLWENEHMQDLQTLGGPDAWAAFINQQGQVAGYSYTNYTPNSTTGIPTIDPFLWVKGRGMIDLGTLGGTVGLTFGLNNRGQVIGQSNVAGDQIADPFLWDGNKMIDMFTDGVGGSFILANGINDSGAVVGVAAFSENPFAAAIWRNGVVTNLGTLPGDCYSMALVINSKDQIAGASFPCDFSAEHAVLWENGAIVDLTALISEGSGAQMVEPNALNDNGEIATDGLPAGCTDFGSCSQAYVLVQCDSVRVDQDGCEDDAGKSTTPQKLAAPTVPRSGIPLQQSLISREIAARINARLGRNRPFATGQNK